MANRRNSDACDISSIGYTVNAIGQRTHATRTGAATNSTDWGYDSLGQVVQADDSINTSDRAYQYDTIAAHFEYDPFGNTVVNSDTAGQFPYRFSTKPLDSETGLYYYNYRYYDPATGRWLSRDPLGEEGGLNLYGFVGENPIGIVDTDGRFSLVITGVVVGAIISAYGVYKLWSKADKAGKAIGEAGQEAGKHLSDPHGNHIAKACDKYAEARGKVGDLADEAASAAAGNMMPETGSEIGDAVRDVIHEVITN